MSSLIKRVSDVRKKMEDYWSQGYDLICFHRVPTLKHHPMIAEFYIEHPELVWYPIVMSSDDKPNDNMNQLLDVVKEHRDLISTQGTKGNKRFIISCIGPGGGSEEPYLAPQLMMQLMYEKCRMVELPPVCTFPGTEHQQQKEAEEAKLARFSKALPSLSCSKVFHVDIPGNVNDVMNKKQQERQQQPAPQQSFGIHDAYLSLFRLAFEYQSFELVKSIEETKIFLFRGCVRIQTREEISQVWFECNQKLRMIIFSWKDPHTRKQIKYDLSLYWNKH